MIWRTYIGNLAIGDDERIAEAVVANARRFALKLEGILTGLFRLENLLAIGHPNIMAPVTHTLWPL